MAPVGRYDDVEGFWDAILSERADEVQAAWATLDGGERRDVEAHLLRMSDPAHEFAAVQQAAARGALGGIRRGTPAN